jgi:hypothetical protein
VEVEQGKTLEQLSAEGWKEVPPPAAPTPDAPAKSRDFKILGVNIHVPAEEKPRLDSNVAGFSEGGGVAPEDALMVGQGVRKIGQAATGGIIASAKEAVAQAAPWMKYEVAHQVLRAAGVPDVVAIPLAGALSNMGGKGKAPSGPVDPAAPHLDRSVPVRAGELTQQQIGERLRFGQGTPTARAPEMAPRPAPSVVPEPPVTATAAPVAKGPSPTVISSEAALAARRELYQVSQSQGWTQTEYGQALKLRAQGMPNADIIDHVQQVRAAAPVMESPAVPKLQLTSQEMGQALRWQAQGVPEAQILERIRASRAFNAAHDLKTPTKAETRFVKGQRGGDNPPSWER